MSHYDCLPPILLHTVGLAQLHLELLFTEDKHVLPVTPRAPCLCLLLYFCLCLYIIATEISTYVHQEIFLDFFIASLFIAVRTWMFSKSLALIGWGIVGHLDHEIRSAEGLDHHQVPAAMLVSLT